MVIFLDPRSDILILDSKSGFRFVTNWFAEFLATETVEGFLGANTDVSADPYEQLLSGMRIRKTSGPIEVSILGNRELLVVGSLENLAEYARTFDFASAEECSHRHPDNISRPNYIRPGSRRVIVELDTSRIEELERHQPSA